MRGMLTEDVQHMAKKFLRREISVEELRLYPYIDYCIKNGQGWSYEKINPEEVKILNKLDREEHIIYSPENHSIKAILRLHAGCFGNKLCTGFFVIQSRKKKNQGI